MGYYVDAKKPSCCNKCNFGVCSYYYGLVGGKGSISNIDHEFNECGTYGYSCNLDYAKKRKYTIVRRAKIYEDIEPIDCPLIECALKEAEEKC